MSDRNETHCPELARNSTAPDPRRYATFDEWQLASALLAAAAGGYFDDHYPFRPGWQYDQGDSPSVEGDEWSVYPGTQGTREATIEVRAAIRTSTRGVAVVYRMDCLDPARFAMLVVHLEAAGARVTFDNPVRSCEYSYPGNPYRQLAALSIKWEKEARRTRMQAGPLSIVAERLRVLRQPGTVPAGVDVASRPEFRRHDVVSFIAGGQIEQGASVVIGLNGTVVRTALGPHAIGYALHDAAVGQPVQIQLTREADTEAGMQAVIQAGGRMAQQAVADRTTRMVAAMTSQRDTIRADVAGAVVEATRTVVGQMLADPPYREFATRVARRLPVTVDGHTFMGGVEALLAEHQIPSMMHDIAERAARDHAQRVETQLLTMLQNANTNDGDTIRIDPAGDTYEVTREALDYARLMRPIINFAESERDDETDEIVVEAEDWDDTIDGADVEDWDDDP